MATDNAELLRAVQVIVFGSDPPQHRSFSSTNRWSRINAGVFVTVYRPTGTRSADVWCCMSNGEYDGRQTVFTNAIESARICASQDSRRGLDRVPPPGSTVELSVLAPRSQWKIVHNLSNMSADKRLTIAVVTNTKRMAIYLPAVWTEENQLSPQELIASLVRKADPLAKSADAVYEIKTLDINQQNHSVNGGGVRPNVGVISVTKRWQSVKRGGARSKQWQSVKGGGARSNAGVIGVISVIGNAMEFYLFNADRKVARLAYLVTPTSSVSKISFDNEGSFVRSYFDVGTLSRVARYLNKVTLDVERIIHTATVAFPARNDSELTARILFLKDTNQFISEKLVDTLVRSDAVFSLDGSFGGPQAMIAIATSSTPQTRMFQRYVQHYLACGGQIDRMLRENGAFAAHWHLKAWNAGRKNTGNNYLDQPCVHQSVTQMLDTCLHTLRQPSSITIEACAFSGLAATFIDPTVANTFGQQSRTFRAIVPVIVNRWSKLQQSWLSESHGGFRYYKSQPWYRTDVTSHICDALLLWSIAEIE